MPFLPFATATATATATANATATATATAMLLLLLLLQRPTNASNKFQVQSRAKKVQAQIKKEQGIINCVQVQKSVKVMTNWAQNKT